MVKNEKFLLLCNDILVKIKNKELNNISNEKFKNIKEDNFAKIIDKEIIPDIVIYIIDDETNK